MRLLINQKLDNSYLRPISNILIKFVKSIYTYKLLKFNEQLY